MFLLWNRISRTSCYNRNNFFVGCIMKSSCLPFNRQSSSGFGIRYSLLTLCWRCVAFSIRLNILLRIIDKIHSDIGFIYGYLLTEAIWSANAINYNIYLFLLFCVVFYVWFAEEQLWNNKWIILKDIAPKLLKLYSLILGTALVVYIEFEYTMIRFDIYIDLDWREILAWARLMMLVLIICRTIIKFNNRQINKKTKMEAMFSLCVTSLATAFVFFIISVIIPGIYFVFIGEGSSGPSGSSSSGNNPGGGWGGPPPRPRTTLNTILAAYNSEASNSNSDVPSNNSNVPDNNSSEPVSNGNRYVTVLQKVEDYCTDRMKGINTEYDQVKRECAGLEWRLKKNPSGFMGQPAEMASFHENEENKDLFDEYSYSLSYTNLNHDYQMKMRERVALEREYRDLSKILKNIREVWANR